MLPLDELPQRHREADLRGHLERVSRRGHDADRDARRVTARCSHRCLRGADHDHLRPAIHGLGSRPPCRHPAPRRAMGPRGGRKFGQAPAARPCRKTPPAYPRTRPFPPIDSTKRSHPDRHIRFAAKFRKILGQPREPQRGDLARVLPPSPVTGRNAKRRCVMISCAVTKGVLLRQQQQIRALDHDVRNLRQHGGDQLRLRHAEPIENESPSAGSRFRRDTAPPGRRAPPACSARKRSPSRSNPCRDSCAR